MTEPGPGIGVSPWRIVPLGDRALLIELGEVADRGSSRRARRVARMVDLACLPDVTDVVPAFRTVAVHYRCRGASGGVPQFDRIRRELEVLLASGTAGEDAAPRMVEVPVCYGGEFGPDLEDVATRCSLSLDEVVALHSASTYVVEMLGFAPGFPYLGGLDARLAVPRRATPRTAVPKGSVAIANDQSVIYPLEIPGGWNLIGRSPVTLFQPSAEPPCLLQPGDHVRFVPVGPERFRALEDASIESRRIAMPQGTESPT